MKCMQKGWSVFFLVVSGPCGVDQPVEPSYIFFHIILLNAFNQLWLPVGAISSNLGSER